jgi:hypothetical protein
LVCPRAHDDTVNSRVVGDQRYGAGAVPDLDTLLARDLSERIDQARPAAHRLDREPAPELELAADVERLPSPRRREAHAVATHPDHRRQTLPDQRFSEVRIAAVLGHPRHVVEELLLGVGAEVAARDLVRREVDHPLQVLDAVVDDAHQAGGEARVAAGFFFRGSFQQENLLGSFRSGYRGTKRRVATADHDHVVHR